MQFTIRPLNISDGPAILRLHQRSFEEAWQNIDSLLHLHSTVGWMAVHMGEPIGFILWQLTKGEADVLSFTVLPEYRRQGIGRALYQASEKEFLSQGVIQLFLEVAQNNKAAITFYQHQGFLKTGVRKNYYRDNHLRTVDALTFCKTLKLE